MGEIIPAGFGATPWPNLFQALFGANSADWAKTLAAWSLLFDAEGRSNSELVSAVHALTRRSPVPQFPTQFLEALRDELRQQDSSMRRNQEARRVEESVRPARCGICGDSGWVCGLPHLSSVHGLEWTKPRWTCAVTCACDTGQVVASKWAQRQPEPKPVLGLLEYTRKNPGWEAQVETRRLEAAAEWTTTVQENGPPEWMATVQAILSRYQGDAVTEMPF